MIEPDTDSNVERNKLLVKGHLQVDASQSFATTLSPIPQVISTESLSFQLGLPRLPELNFWSLLLFDS